jgi:hypothetical protein
MSHLESFPIAELISVSGDLRIDRPLDEIGRKRIRESLAGAHAIGRMGSYRFMLREVDTCRQHLGYKGHMLDESVVRLR